MTFLILALAFAAAVTLYLIMPLVSAKKGRVAGPIGGAAVFVAVATYLAVGSPQLATLGGPRAPAGGDIEAEIEARIAADPDDVTAWLSLARTRLDAADYDGAADAFRELIARDADIEGLQSAFGETLVFARGGVVDPEAKAAFEAAVAKDPQDARARYYLAEADYQAGRADAAIDAWARLVEDSEPGAPWLAVLGRRLASALVGQERSLESLGLSDEALAALENAARGGAPQGDAADAVAGLDPEEPADMIEGMVAGLAARLEENPDDLDGWRMLARSYAVLGRLDDLARAYGEIARLSPGDVDAARSYAYARLRAERPGEPLDDATVAALETLLAADPQDALARLVIGEREFRGSDVERGRALLEGLVADESVDPLARGRAEETLAAGPVDVVIDESRDQEPDDPDP